MAFWVWAVAGMVFGLMLYEIGSWIKRKINPPEDLTEEAQAAATESQAELARANMKIAVLESRLEEAKLEMEAEITALKQEQKEQQAKTEAAYQRQMITMSERLASNGRGDWRVAAEREKEQQLAAQENYPVRMAAEVAAWKATTLGEEPNVESAVSEDLANITRENNEHIDEQDPAVNTLSEETAVPNSQPVAQNLDGEADSNEIAAAVAAISGLDLAEIDADSGGAQGVGNDGAGEQWVLLGHDGPQNSDTNGHTLGAAQRYYDERPVDINAWLDDGDEELLGQITVLDEVPEEVQSVDQELLAAVDVQDYLMVVEEPQEAAHPAVDLALLVEEEHAAADDVDQDVDPEPQNEQLAALMAGLAAGTVVLVVEDALKNAPDESSAVNEALPDSTLEADEPLPDSSENADDALPDSSAELGDDIPADTAVAGEDSAAFENRWPDLEDQAMQRVMARRLSSEMDADYLDDEELLREMGIEQTAPQQELLFGAEAEDSMGAENWVTDPLEEMANHINGESPILPDASQNEESAGDEVGSAQIEVADHMWEEMVYTAATAAREDAGLDAGEEAGEDTGLDAGEDIGVDAGESYQPQMALSDAGENGAEEAVEPEDEVVEPVDEAAEEPLVVEEPDSDALYGAVNEEDEMIAATVAAILSRAPEGSETVDSDPTWEPAAQQPPHSALSDSSESDGAAPEPFKDEDPLAGVPLEDTLFEEFAAGARNGDAAGTRERPSQDWERQPVLWQAEYYDNTKLSDAPVVVRQDREIDFHWRDRAPAQGIEPRTFSVRWSGFLPLEAGHYRFTASGPDGMRMWLNDRLVISAWYDQSEQTYQRDFNWNGGAIDVRVEHYENGGDAKAFLTWDRIA